MLRIPVKKEKKKNFKTEVLQRGSRALSHTPVSFEISTHQHKLWNWERRRKQSVATVENHKWNESSNNHLHHQITRTQIAAQQISQFFVCFVYNHQQDQQPGRIICQVLALKWCFKPWIFKHSTTWERYLVSFPQ